MKRLLLLLTLTVFLFGCKGRGGPQQIKGDDILERLTCEDQSLLEKMDKNLNCNFGETKKFSVSLTVKPRNEDAFSVSVETFGHSTAVGQVPNFTAYLAKGNNTVRIVCTSKKDPTYKREYRIRIVQSSAGVSEKEGSKLKVLKFDDQDMIALRRVNSRNVCELPDVDINKAEANLLVEAHNPSASIKVSNGSNTIEKGATGTHKVPLMPGPNEIHIVVTSDKEVDVLYAIKLYRTEDLGLKSFKIEDVEYANAGRISTPSLKFATEKVKVSVSPNTEGLSIILKHNGTKMEARDGVYTLDLVPSNNGVEVVIEGIGAARSKSHKITLIRLSQESPNAGFIKLNADGTDILPLISTEKATVLPSCDHGKGSLTLEMLTTPAYIPKVMCKGQEVQGTNGSYVISLEDGLNTLTISLNKDGIAEYTYTVYITRHPDAPALQAPATDEVTVTFLVSDGVNGSGVDGSYLNVYTSKDGVLKNATPILIRNGKAMVNLKKDEYYEFRIAGQTEEHSPIRYAASNVSSYYLQESTKIVPIIQRPLQRITKSAEAPELTELKFDQDVLNVAQEKEVTEMQDFTATVKTSSHIEKLKLYRASPAPMLGVGFVPTKAEEKNNLYVFTADNISENTKGSDGKYTSSWKWDTKDVLLTKEEYVDVVLVFYDIASNRLERHVRLKNTTTAAIPDDGEISISEMKLDFTRYPTQSLIYSVDKDEGTGTGGHYTAEISFYVKKGEEYVICKAFDLYRKCLDDATSDFTVVKHIVNKQLIQGQEGAPHKIYESDGSLEDGKTYEYKVVSYTNDGTKSVLNSAPSLKVKVPKSTTLFLQYPVFDSIALSEAENLGFTFKFSNPDLLQDAKEIKMGLMIAERTGTYIYGSKFKYVFADSQSNGNPELYFATKLDAKLDGQVYLGTGYSKKASNFTNKSLQDLITVDKESGTVKIKKDFLLIDSVNMPQQGKSVTYKKGVAYHWDVLDWGLAGTTDFNKPCQIVMNSDPNVTVSVCVNDGNNGANAWNGRAEFTVKWD